MTHENLIETAINRTLNPTAPTTPPAPKAKSKVEPAEVHPARAYTDADFHPRYIAYANVRSRSPQAQHEADGRSMAGFIAWINNRWEQWCAMTNQRASKFDWNSDLGLFDAWCANGATI